MLTTILTFNYFDMIWVLTRGGPQNATAYLPDQDLRARLRPVPLRRGGGLRVFSILVLALLVALYFAVAARGREGRCA